MKKKVLLFGLVGALMTVGCQSQTTSLYHWGDYQHNLLDYMTDLQGNDANQAEVGIEGYQQDLSEIIHDAMAKKTKTPPGLYSEYGYLHYLRGAYGESITYYQKEAEIYPESRFFMTQLISQSKTAQQWKGQSDD